MDTNPRIENIGEATILRADVFCVEDIIELVYKLDVQYRRDAIFLAGAGTMMVVRKLKTGDGEYLWGSDWPRARKQPTHLLGYEIVRREHLPAVETGKHAIIFADRLWAAKQGWIEWPADLDWQCEYCGRVNAGIRTSCVSCGGPRSWADYGG